MLLTGTTWNCSGGKTPWDTWISCEESDSGRGIWQVDPWGRRDSELTEMGDRNNSHRSGIWEAFAYDLSGADGNINRYFITEDTKAGPVRRFTPKDHAILSWEVFHEEGTHEYLLLNYPAQGQFTWSTSLSAGRTNAEQYYRNVEGIDCRDGHLYFVSKKLKQLYDLDLNAKTFQITSTLTQAYSGEPDNIIFLDRRDLQSAASSEYEVSSAEDMFTSTQLQRVLGNKKKSRYLRNLNENFDDPILYMTEDGTTTPGIFGMDSDQNFFSILELANPRSDGRGDETTGVAFSPDRKKMFFCQQHEGICFEVWRKDGYTFKGEYLSVKYHHQISCFDDHENCNYWAERGECEINPNWMLVHCKYSCNACYD